MQGRLSLSAVLAQIHRLQLNRLIHLEKRLIYAPWLLVAVSTSGSTISARRLLLNRRTVFLAEIGNSRVNTSLFALFITLSHAQRIKFGKPALKCIECRGTCHVDCKSRMPMPCVPTVQTPSNKGFVGTVADYAPNKSPMIPALVIHCVNEIERRGMSEVGIYRVNGSEKEIKDMKVNPLRNQLLSIVRTRCYLCFRLFRSGFCAARDSPSYNK